MRKDDAYNTGAIGRSIVIGFVLLGIIGAGAYVLVSVINKDKGNPATAQATQPQNRTEVQCLDGTIKARPQDCSQLPISGQITLTRQATVARATSTPSAQATPARVFPRICDPQGDNGAQAEGTTRSFKFVVPQGATASVWGGVVNQDSDEYRVFMEGANVDATVSNGANCLVDKNSAEQAWNKLLADTAAAGNPRKHRDCPSGWTCRP